MRQFLICAFFCIFGGTAFPVGSQTTEPAVSGWNSKLGLSHVSPNAVIFRGSLTGPLTERGGVQFDLDLGLMDRRYYAPFSWTPSSGLKPIIGTGIHFFMRDPSHYLLGAFVSRHVWNTVAIDRLGVEFELYRNQFTLGGALGSASYQFGTLPGQNYLSHFGSVELSYYFDDNTKFSADIGVEDKIGSMGFGIEKGTVSERITSTYSAYIRRTATGETSLELGVTFYFGPGSNTTLLQSHRTADPRLAMPEFPELYTVSGLQSVAVQCPGCTDGTSGTCQNPGRKICTSPLPNGRCPRQFSPCTNIVFYERIGPTWPYK